MGVLGIPSIPSHGITIKYHHDIIYYGMIIIIMIVILIIILIIMMIYYIVIIINRHSLLYVVICCYTIPCTTEQIIHLDHDPMWLAWKPSLRSSKPQVAWKRCRSNLRGPTRAPWRCHAPRGLRSKKDVAKLCDVTMGKYVGFCLAKITVQ